MYDAASLHRYGTPLPTLEEDEVPSKKPIRPEDQIVTDENGKRRFHGAFTGGFSAGYWNTVGSQEGWTPASFKSSRTEKAPARAQLRPEDFMDAEDLGEFGIAPQRMQARAEFTDDTNRKRRHEPPSTGVIPGRPVLEQLIQPRSENIGERILMSMGWRPGQGVGPRLTREKKKQVRQRRQHEDYLRRHYGDQSAQSALTDESSGSNSDNEGSDDGVTYAPDDYLPYVCQPKNDCFGLGYKEFLSRDPVLSQRHAKTSGGMATTSAAASGHINLFAPPPLQLVGKNNKTLSITGQAFGVGALEEDDEDIYARDDMTRYDFSLDDGKKRKEKKEEFVQDRAVLTGFQAAKNPTQCVPRYVVQLPDGFKPRNWLQRKCRFEPLDPERVKELERSFKHLEAKGELGPQQRGDLLDDESERPSTSAHARSQVASAHRLDGIKRLTDTTQQLFTRLAQIDRFTSGGVESSDKEEDLACQVAREQQELLQKARMKTKLLASDLTSMDFKPFITDEAKQKRYDEFLAANVTNETDIRAFLNKIQPIHLSSYDREMEKKEFVQAKNLYKPLEGSMAERFVSGAQCQEEQKAADQPNPDKSFKPKRTRSMWIPASLLCRRFNIAEPHGGAMAEEKQQPRTKLSIFNYLEGSVNKKSDFQTPVIIPKSMASTAKPRPIVRHERMDQTESGSTVVSRSTCKNVDVSISTNKRVQHKIMDETESCGAGVSQSSDKSRHDKVDKDKKSQESLNIWLVPPSEMGLSKSESDLQQVKEATTTATPASMLGRYKPKTALEKLVEEARDKPAWDKVDIYHAIFDDSSDDEAGRSGDNEPVKVTVITKRTSSSQTPEGDLPGTKKPTSANILRNDSPPRGIFKVLFPKDEKEAGTSKGISCSDSDTKRAQQERLKDLKSRLVDQLDHAKEASQPEARNDAAATPSKGGPVRIVFQPKSERLSGAGTTTPDSDDPTITAPVYGPKMPDFFKAPSTSASKDTFTVVSETTVDKKLRRLLEVHKAARGLPTIKEEEWVEKTLTEHDRSSSVDSDSSTDSDSDSDSDAASRKQKKRSKKKKYKKKNSKESEIKLRKKGKKVKKKSKKSKKSHKSKKSKNTL